MCSGSRTGVRPSPSLTVLCRGSTPRSAIMLGAWGEVLEGSAATSTGVDFGGGSRTQPASERITVLDAFRPHLAKLPMYPADVLPVKHASSSHPTRRSAEGNLRILSSSLQAPGVPCSWTPLMMACPFTCRIKANRDIIKVNTPSGCLWCWLMQNRSRRGSGPEGGPGLTPGVLAAR